MTTLCLLSECAPKSGTWKLGRTVEGLWLFFLVTLQNRCKNIYLVWSYLFLSSFSLDDEARERQRCLFKLLFKCTWSKPILLKACAEWFYRWWWLVQHYTTPTYGIVFESFDQFKMCFVYPWSTSFILFWPGKQLKEFLFSVIKFNQEKHLTFLS
jgi:hypothetical protein